MDIDVNRIRELLNKREEIDQALANILTATKKSIKCGHCGEEGHSARTCSRKSEQ